MGCRTRQRSCELSAGLGLWRRAKAASPNVDLLRASVARADGSLVALVTVVAKPFALIGRFALCTHGPAWIGEVTLEEKRETYRTIRKSIPQRWPKLLVFTPDEPAGAAAGLNGMSCVMTGDATVLIDLTQDEGALRSALEPSWRNKLSKAERSDLVLQKSGLEARAIPMAARSRNEAAPEARLPRHAARTHRTLAGR